MPGLLHPSTASTHDVSLWLSIALSAKASRHRVLLLGWLCQLYWRGRCFAPAHALSASGQSTEYVQGSGLHSGAQKYGYRLLGQAVIPHCQPGPKVHLQANMGMQLLHIKSPIHTLYKGCRQRPSDREISYLQTHTSLKGGSLDCRFRPS